jgi:uncharacterized protein with NRDE domain
MCVLIAGWKLRSGVPLVVAANRDEDLGRAFEPPRWSRTAHGAVLAPHDRRAGGTWLGVRPDGLCVAITNRRDGDVDPGRRSRGWLCETALAQADAGALLGWLETETAHQHYNSFNLFFADRRQAWVASWNGRLQSVELAPGAHVLSNEHGLDALALPELERLDWQQPQAGLDTALAAILASHHERDAGGWSICKHGARYGTVCSSRVVLPDTGPGWLDWAPGPPCRTAFERSVLDGAESL